MLWQFILGFSQNSFIASKVVYINTPKTVAKPQQANIQIPFCTCRYFYRVKNTTSVTRKHISVYSWI